MKTFLFLLKNELKLNIGKTKFIIAFVLVALMFLFNALFFSIKFSDEIKDFELSQEENNSLIKNYSKNLANLTLVSQKIYLKPDPIYILSKPQSSQLPDYASMNLYNFKFPLYSKQNIYSLIKQESFDAVFIITIIMTLLALILSYDAFIIESSNKNQQILYSFKIKKAHQLLAKYLSIIILLSLVLGFGLIIDMGFVIFYKYFQDIFLWKLIITYFISLIFLSIFTLLGLYLSLIIKKSYISIILLVFIWSVLVILIPASEKALAGIFYPIPSQYKVQKKIKQMQDNVWNKRSLTPDEKLGIDDEEDCNKEYARKRAKLSMDLDRIGFEMKKKQATDKINQILSVKDKLTFSPVVMFKNIIEKISNTGIYKFDNFFNEFIGYYNKYSDFIIKEDLKDPASKHLFSEENAWANVCMSKLPLDPNKLPRFPYQAPGLLGAVLNVMDKILILIFINGILLLLCFRKMKAYKPI
ncbi:MAG: ABC transporter permease subunit [Pseudomonadota bacterium]